MEYKGYQLTFTGWKKRGEWQVAQWHAHAPNDRRFVTIVSPTTEARGLELIKERIDVVDSLPCTAVK